MDTMERGKRAAVAVMLALGVKMDNQTWSEEALTGDAVIMCHVGDPMRHKPHTRISVRVTQGGCWWVNALVVESEMEYPTIWPITNYDIMRSVVDPGWLPEWVALPDGWHRHQHTGEVESYQAMREREQRDAMRLREKRKGENYAMATEAESPAPPADTHATDSFKYAMGSAVNANPATRYPNPNPSILGPGIMMGEKQR